MCHRFPTESLALARQDLLLVGDCERLEASDWAAECGTTGVPEDDALFMPPIEQINSLAIGSGNGSGEPLASPGSSSSATPVSTFAPARVMCFSDEMRSFTPHTVEKCLVKTVPEETERPRRATPARTVQLRKGHSAALFRDGDERQEITNNDVLPPRITPDSFSCSMPRVSRSSLKLLQESATFEPDFQVRMQQFVTKNRMRKEQIRLAACEAEDGCIQPTPTINRVRGL